MRKLLYWCVYIGNLGGNNILLLKEIKGDKYSTIGYGRETVPILRVMLKETPKSAS